MSVNPTTQLEIAAHWLTEAAMTLDGLKISGLPTSAGKDLAGNLRRVSGECLRVADAAVIAEAVERAEPKEWR